MACCSRRFLPLARRIVGNNDLAEDVLQESWIRVLEHVCDYRGDSPGCSWVRSIVRNCALDLGRGVSLATEEPPHDLEDPSLDPEALAQRRQLIRLLREIVAALPLAYREVCVLRFGKGLSRAETAHLLGISPSNVSTRLERAVKMLRKRLDARLQGR